jgi:predicted HTH transcriptional regulator
MLIIFRPGHPRIRIFTSHIEFYNPGGLPKPLKRTEEQRYFPAEESDTHQAFPDG